MKKKKRTFFYYLFFFSLVFIFFSAGKRIRLRHADTFEFRKKNGKEIRILTGNVLLEHKGTLMYCDRANLDPEKNALEAFDNVRVLQGDSINITGDYLEFDGGTSQAIVQGDCELTTKTGVLYTEKIGYNTKTRTAVYEVPSKLVSEKITLESEKGKYFSNTGLSEFEKNVTVLGEGFLLENEKLLYNEKKKQLFFSVLTKITLEDSTLIISKKGMYDFSKEIISVGNDAKIYSKTKTIESDKIVYRKKDSLIECFVDVIMTDTLEGVSIFGNYAFMDEKKQSGFFSDSAYVTLEDASDTMRIASDSIFYYLSESDSIEKIVFENHAQLLTKDMSARSDSIIYLKKDSFVLFYGTPTFWLQNYQIRSDFSRLQMKNDSLDNIEFIGNPFITNERSEKKGFFDQVIGKEMKAFFKKNELSRFQVTTNVVSLYYLSEDSVNTEFSGLNRIEAKFLEATIVKRKMRKIVFSEKPIGRVTPIKMLTEKEKFLTGFLWLESLRPRKEEDLFSWVEE